MLDEDDDGMPLPVSDSVTSYSNQFEGHEERVERWRQVHRTYLAEHPEENEACPQKAARVAPSCPEKPVPVVADLPSGVRQDDNRFHARVRRSSGWEHLGSYLTVEEAAAVAAAAREARAAEKLNRRGVKKKDALMPKAVEMRSQGMSYARIARELVISELTVQRWLNPEFHARVMASVARSKAQSAEHRESVAAKAAALEERRERAKALRGEGKTYKEIAAEIGVSKRAVQRYLTEAEQQFA